MQLVQDRRCQLRARAAKWMAECDGPAVHIQPIGIDRQLAQARDHLRRERLVQFHQVDLVGLNEAFAAQAIACLRELPIDPDRVNVNGGAIALGHPLGCTGAKLTTSIIYEMQRRKARYGLVTMCVGGGMGAAGIFERM